MKGPSFFPFFLSLPTILEFYFEAEDEAIDNDAVGKDDSEAIKYMMKAMNPKKKSKAEKAMLYELVEKAGFEESELSALHKLLGDPSQLNAQEQREYEKAEYLMEEVMRSIFEKYNAKSLGIMGE